MRYSAYYLAWTAQHSLARAPAERPKRLSRIRNPARYRSLRPLGVVEPHPIFYVVKGGVEPWERAKARRRSLDDKAT